MRNTGRNFGKLAISLACILLLSAFGEHNHGTRFVEGNFGLAAKLATDADRPLMVFVGAPYCSFSQRMEGVFGTQEVGIFYNKRFVCKRLDTGNPIHNIRASNWGVTTVPTFLFMDKDRNIIHRVTGYRTPQAIIEEGQLVLKKIEDEKRRRRF